jgi:hypothetical protein
MGREHLTYHFVPFKITSFLRRNSKRMLQIFYMKKRKYINSKTNIVKFFYNRTTVRLILIVNLLFC